MKRLITLVAMITLMLVIQASAQVPRAPLVELNSATT